MRFISMLSVLAVMGCSDWNVNKITDDVVGPDDDTDTGLTGKDTGDTDVPPEICNGEDDDGDGLIDEGFRDSDGDGEADCTDEDCEVEMIPELTVTVPEECEAVVVTVADPWDVDIEWSYTASGYGVIVMPAVGNLTDDNGDGVVDQLDNPDIVFTTWYGNTLVALHGDGSGVIFEQSGYNGQAGVTIADVDSDGESEIIALTSSSQIVAVNGAGTKEWSSGTVSVSAYPQPAVADLDGDGDVEVIMDTAVVDGSTGAALFTLTGVKSSWRTPVPADLDDDGTLEIILAERVFSHTGALEWTAPTFGSGFFAAVANIDSDRGGEVFFVSGSTVYVVDHDGTSIRSFTVPARNPGAPSIADYDGDGDVEIAISGGAAISVHEVDGTELWRSTIKDSSGLAGNSGYDIDGDGQFELLYADEEALRIYDGKTGTKLYEDFNHASATVWEYPVIADVDNDGSAEIVVASNSWASTTNGITVFGHKGSGWAKSGPTWPTHDYAVTTINPDGSVPTGGDLSWISHNLFRARPTVDSPGAPDLIPVIGEVCVASCVHGPIKVAWSVQNAGGVDQDAGVDLVLYSIGSDETLTERARAVLPFLPTGTQIEGSQFEIDPADWEEGILLRVDDPGTSGSGRSWECDESNNEAELRESFCD